MRTPLCNLILFHGAFLISLLVFEHNLLPWVYIFLMGGEEVPEWSRRARLWFWTFLMLLYHVTWSVPMLILNTFIGGLRIKELVHVVQKVKGQSDLKNISLTHFLAQQVYASTFYVIFFLQCVVCTWIPYLGPILNFTFMSWSYALYCFEWKWSNLVVEKRLELVEMRWAYYAGFGCIVSLPTTLASIWGGFFFGYAIWFLFFPFFLITTLGIVPPHGNNNISMKSRDTFASPFYLSKRINDLVLSGISRGIMKMRGNDATK